MQVRLISKPISAAGHIAFDREAVADGTGERHLVGIFQLTPKGDPAGNRSHLHARGGGGRKLLLNKINGCVPLDGGVKCKDQFLYIFLVDAVDQGIDIQLIRTYAIEGRNDSPKHVVGAIKLLGAFNGDHITYILHNTDQFLLALGIGTDGTDVCIRHVKATLAEFDILTHPDDGFSKTLDHGRFLF